ncbi:MAG: glycosyltransferase [Fuerstiella sp.]
MQQNTAARPVALLVSLGPVDGYPPVQYQAVLLARAGFDVVVLTCPLAGSKHVSFAGEHISVVSVPLQSKSRETRLFALAKLSLDLVKIRWQNRNRMAVEIAYEPNAAFYSDWCPIRSHLRVVHLHETLIDPQNQFYERCAVRRLHTFDRIVVADEDRADLLVSQLALRERPSVIPNYPLLVDSEAIENRSGKHFETVYVGALGENQALDSVIRSVDDWLPHVRLHLVGADDTNAAMKLRALAQDCGVTDRVVFHGRLPLAEVPVFLRKCHLGFSFLRDHHDQLRFATGASNKRYQYMQAGMPQVSDLNPRVTALIEEQGIGRCVHPDDLSGITEVVNFFARNPGECTRAGRQAEELYLRQYHYELPFREFVEWVNRDWERRQETVTQRDTRHAAIH